MKILSNIQYPNTSQYQKFDLYYPDYKTSMIGRKNLMKKGIMR